MVVGMADNGPSLFIPLRVERELRCATAPSLIASPSIVYETIDARSWLKNADVSAMRHCAGSCGIVAVRKLSPASTRFETMLAVELDLNVLVGHDSYDRLTETSGKS